jgi:hypothetical protein
MDNVSMKIMLTALECAMVDSPTTGKKLLVIPIEENSLYLSEKGNVYLDLIAFPVKTATKDQTHVIKQSRPKDIREKMSEEEKKNQPIVGNLKVWTEGGSHEEAAPNVSADASEAAKKLPF